MNSREVVRRIRAFHAGRPLPSTQTLHCHIADDANLLIVAFVRMGGESRPWGMAYGYAGKKPTVLTVPEGRNRDLVAEMMAQFAPRLLAHLQCPRFTRRTPDSAAAIGVLRQVWLPNPTHLEMLHHLAYAYTFTKWGGAMRESLNALGRACGWLFREAQRPGEQHVMVATDALRGAFTFPAEDARQGHLGFLLAWLLTRGGRDRRIAAAMEAEKSAVATSLNPDVERAIEADVQRWGQHVRDRDQKGRLRSTAAIDRVLRSELERRYHLTQAAVSVLRADKRRVNSGVAALVRAALDEQWQQYLRIELRVDSEDDGPSFVPSPETDRHPAAAGSRYLVHQASADLMEAVLLHDDAELQAEAIASGDAFRGEIVKVWDRNPGRATAPVWIVRDAFTGPLRLRAGSRVCVVGMPRRRGIVQRIDVARDGALLMEVEIINLKTAAPDGRGVHALAPVDPQLVGQTMTLVTDSAEGISRSKSIKIWKQQVPGAWLTHARPAGERARPAREIDVDDVDSVESRA